MHNNRCFDTDSKHLHKSGIYIPPRVQRDFRGVFILRYSTRLLLLFLRLHNLLTPTKRRAARREGQHSAKDTTPKRAKQRASRTRWNNAASVTEERHGATKHRRIVMVQKRRKALPAILLEGLPLENKMAATYSPACAVPSARSGLTSLFGMGRGGTPTL